MINANGTGQQRLLQALSWISNLVCYPGIMGLSLTSISDVKSQNGRFILDISEPWYADQLQSRLTPALPENFPVKFAESIAFSPDCKSVAGVAGN